MRIGRRTRVNRVKTWLLDENGSIIDDLLSRAAWMIFAGVAVMVLAGLIWSALSFDGQSLVNALTNLF